MKQLMRLIACGNLLPPRQRHTLLFLVCLTALFLSGVSVAHAVEDKQFSISPGGGQSLSSELDAKAEKSRHPCVRMSPKRLLSRAEPYQQAIQKYAKQYKVEPALIKAVIAVESCYQKKARSPKDAQGLMQLIPATAERFGVKDVYNSSQNIHGGTKYLRWLSRRYSGDLVKVLAAYNAGEGRVDRYKGVPPFKETRLYVKNVLLVYQRLKQTVGESINLANMPSLSVAQRSFASALSALPVVNYVSTPRNKPVSKPQPNVRPLLASQKNHVPAGMIQGGPAQPLPETVRAAAQAQVPRVQKAVLRPSAVAQNKAKPAQAAVKKPVTLRKAVHKPAQITPVQKSQEVPGRKQRVVHHYTPPKPVIRPSKPGRGGWRVNKALAPHLFKQ